jgi:phytoene synthase
MNESLNIPTELILLQKQIFAEGSRTYYYSSVFFPSKERYDVFALYSFVRLADDYVDKVPADKDGFNNFCEDFYHAYSHSSPLPNDSTPRKIINAFVRLSREKDFPLSWIRAFLDAMAADLTKSHYATLDETMRYMYGSAEVVGLMMAKILNLPSVSYPYAQALGRSMQYINFIRDISEDLNLGRYYFPATDLKTHNLHSLTEKEAKEKSKNFHEFINAQVNRYLEWSKEAALGFKYIPYRFRIPIKVATSMYHWTALKIAKDPLVVFARKVKPNRMRILLSGAREVWRW